MKNLSNSGLPDPLPLAPGNRLAGQPAPEHVLAAEDEIPWLAAKKQRWTANRVNAIDRRMKSRAGVHQVGDPQVTNIPGWARRQAVPRRFFCHL